MVLVESCQVQHGKKPPAGTQHAVKTQQAETPATKKLNIHLQNKNGSFISRDNQKEV